MPFSSITRCKDGFILVLTPLLLSPLLIWHYQSTELRCLFVVLLMTVYWMFAPIPLPVTALIPVVAFPLLGLATTEKACEPYLQATNMLFMASLIVAVAMESSGFHKRIALRALILLGGDIRTLFAGFMITTSFLGVWIINTAATAMILPIADVVIQEVLPETGSDEKMDVSQLNSTVVESNRRLSQEHMELLAQQNLPDIDCKVAYQPKLYAKRQYIRRLLYICIAFAATIGGTTTLTSNGPNLVFQFVLDDLFFSMANVDYTNWLLFCLPATILSVILCWLLISSIYLKKEVVAAIRGSPKSILQKKYDELGPLSFHELAVCTMFLCLICLWMFRDPQFMNGWATMLGGKIKPKDTTPAILIVILMFCIPRNPMGPYPSESLLDWPIVQSRLAWGVILLRGGGFSLANTATSSGLTKLIGAQLGPLHQLPVPLIVAIISILASFATELASNSAIATIFLPISSEIAANLGQNPLLFLIPVTLSCSYAFILPVGTPANALVSSHASLKPGDMAIPGLITKFMCLLVMLVNLYALGFPMFGLGQVPDWAAQVANMTLSNA